MNNDKKKTIATLAIDNGGYKGSDEMYTLPYTVEPIIKHMKDYMKVNKKDTLKVWCPFDVPAYSNFVKMLSAIDGVEVLTTPILQGSNFFDYEPDEDYDVIISNPPFKDTRLIFKRLLSFEKPFAMIFSLAKMNDKYPIELFREQGKKPQLLIFNNRFAFLNGLTGKVETKIPFKCGYLCYNFLREYIILEDIMPLSQAKKLYNS